VNLFVGYLGYFFPIGGAATRAAVIVGLMSALAAANICGVRRAS
jgi:hypothetical protein